MIKRQAKSAKQPASYNRCRPPNAHNNRINNVYPDNNVQRRACACKRSALRSALGRIFILIIYIKNLYDNKRGVHTHTHMCYTDIATVCRYATNKYSNVTLTDYDATAQYVAKAAAEKRRLCVPPKKHFCTSRLLVGALRSLIIVIMIKYISALAHISITCQ